MSRMGYRLAIDDFGSGYTSITQLVQYPTQKSNWIRAFLETLIGNRQSEHSKTSDKFVPCTRKRRLPLAGSIETKRMHQWLQEAQCDMLQGYYFGKPMPLEDLSDWYREHQLQFNQQQ
ncbi:EAL domain-containing protein [Vibrio lentus]|nr:EAL domain-containing protein [Vibrio lentus]